MERCYLSRQVPVDAAAHGGTPRVEPVTISHGYWIGAGAMFHPGVAVAPGSIIAGGTVVQRDTEPN